MKTRKLKSPAMESKRKATTDLNHDNWDKEEETEEKGTFQVASFEELQNRVIKKAKRKIATPGDGTPANKTVFSGFSGFTSSPAVSTGAATASPFSFLSKLSQPAATTKPQTVPEESTKSITKPTESAKKEENSFGFEKSNSYYAKLKGLNQQVSIWIKTHVDKNPLCILTPIFSDYEKYLKEIQESSENSTKQNALEGNSGSSPKIGVVDKKPADSTLSQSSMFSSGGFSFKPTTNIPESKPSQSSILSSSTSAQSIFSISSKTSETTSSNTGFSFSSSKPFTFGSSVTKPETVKPEENNENEEDEDTPPKVEFKPVVEEDSVFSKKCKIFVKSGANYADRGVGTLYVKPIKDSAKKQLLVRADTNLGNILLNIILSDAIPSQRLGKNNVMLVCIPTPDADPKPTSVLLRVKTGEEADELLAIIEKYKK